MSNNTIVFPHCPKTGGTTLKERYRNTNPSFRITDLGHKVTEQTKVIFGHSVQIGYYEEKLPNNLIYITCVRDPISRIMSMYNFYRTQILYMNPDSPDIDFYMWFINKDVLRPMPVTKQYEYYLFQHVEHTDWFNDGTLKNTFTMNDMYLNTVLTWDVEKDTSYVDNKKIQQKIKEKNNIETHNMNITWERVMSKMDHVFFQEDDIVERFDDLLAHYRLDLDAWEEMIYTNETSHDLSKHDLAYVKYHELDDDLKYLVELDLQADLEFYKRCEDKWKR